MSQERTPRQPTRVVRRELARDPQLDPETARQLARDPDRQVRELVAENPACPPDALLVLIQDRSFHVRWNAAKNPSGGVEVRLAALDSEAAEAVGQLGDDLPEPVLAAVLAHPERAVRQQLAWSSRSPEVLRALARDASPAVRAAVAVSESVPPDVLTELAADRRREVRASASANPLLPLDLAVELASDRSKNVRWWLLAHHGNEEPVAELLRDDPDEMNRAHAELALQRLEVPAAVDAAGVVWADHVVARVAALCRDLDADVRTAVGVRVAGRTLELHFLAPSVAEQAFESQVMLYSRLEAGMSDEGVDVLVQGRVEIGTDRRPYAARGVVWVRDQDGTSLV